ncbi:c-type cytochrome [Tsuneonella sp. HG222]
MMRALVVSAALSLFASPAAAREERSPEANWAERCAYCHDARGWGTRALARRVPKGQEELLKRRALPASMVEYVVRNGVGAMPQFNPSELTDAELAALAAWIERTAAAQSR